MAGGPRRLSAFFHNLGSALYRALTKVLTHNIGIILFIKELLYRADRTPLVLPAPEVGSV